MLGQVSFRRSPICVVAAVQIWPIGLASTRLEYEDMCWFGLVGQLEWPKQIDCEPRPVIMFADARIARSEVARLITQQTDKQIA